METPIWCMSVVSVRGISEKEQWPLWSILFGRKVTLQLCPDAWQVNSSHVSLLALKLLPQCWNSEWESPCTGPLSGMPGDPEALCLTQPQSQLFFTTRNYGDFSNWHWILGWGAYCVPKTLRSSGRPPQLRYASRFLSSTCGHYSSPVYISAISTSLHVASSLSP